MLHSLDVMVDHLFVETEQSEEFREELVPPRDVPRYRFSGRSQDQAAIFFVLQQTLSVEALDHVGDARLGNPETGRDVDDAGISFRIDQVENPLEVIFDGGRIPPVFLGCRHGGGR